MLDSGYLRLCLCLAGVLTAVASGSGTEGERQCRADLAALKGCSTRIAAQTACSSTLLLNKTLAREILGCDGSLSDCHRKCLDSLGSLGLPVNSTTADCTVQQQLMKQYSGSPQIVVDFIEDPESGLPRAKMVPSTLATGAGVPSFSYFGDYQRCIYGDGMQYCLVDSSVSAPAAGELKLAALMGLCRPRSCSEAAIHDDVAPLAIQAGFEEYTVDCHRSDDPLPEVEWTAGKEVALGLFAAIAGLVVSGTAWDLLRSSPRQSQAVAADREAVAAKSFLGSFLQAWSLSRNMTSFAKTRPDDGEVSFAVLDGLRVLSTLWVILGHTVIWPLLSVGYENTAMILPPYGRLTQLWFQIVPGGYFAVDTFFWLSGMLGARALHAKVKNSPTLLSVKGFCLRLYPFALLTRWLRLSLVYAFIIIFTQTWYSELGKGGLLWNASTGMSHGMGCASSIDNDTCKTYWWSNLLYINNLIPGQRVGCMAWTWYLACDMQLFLLVPLLVLIRERVGKMAGWVILLLLIVASCAANAWVIWNENLVTDPVLGSLTGSFMEDVYEVSWMRAQPYLIGIGCAWLLEAWSVGGSSGVGFRNTSLEDRGSRVLGVASGPPEPLLAGATDLHLQSRKGRFTGSCTSAFGAVLLQILSFALMCLVVFVPVTRYRCDTLQDCTHADAAPWPMYINILYGAFNHAVWALGMSGLMMLCFYRAPGTCWVTSTLGSTFWQQPMKLTYSAYLVHPLVLVFFYCQGDSSLHYLDATLIGNFFAFSTVVFLVAFVIWLAVEKPMANLCAILLGACTGRSSSNVA